jgi:hypothetical protein
MLKFKKATLGGGVPKAEPPFLSSVQKFSELDSKANKGTLTQKTHE